MSGNSLNIPAEEMAEARKEMRDLYQHIANCSGEKMSDLRRAFPLEKPEKAEDAINYSHGLTKAHNARWVGGVLGVMAVFYAALGLSDTTTDNLAEKLAPAAIPALAGGAGLAVGIRKKKQVLQQVREDIAIASPPAP